MEASFEHRLRGFLAALASRCDSCFNKGSNRCPECFSHNARILNNEFRLYHVVDAERGRNVTERFPELSAMEIEIMSQLTGGRRVRGSNILVAHKGSRADKRNALRNLVSKGLILSESVTKDGSTCCYYSLPPQKD